MDELDTYTEDKLVYWEENDMMDPEEAAFIRGFQEEEGAKV